MIGLECLMQIEIDFLQFRLGVETSWSKEKVSRHNIKSYTKMKDKRYSLLKKRMQKIKKCTVQSIFHAFRALTWFL